MSYEVSSNIQLFGQNGEIRQEQFSLLTSICYFLRCILVMMLTFVILICLIMRKKNILKCIKIL